ncbi:MAG: BTAD domain-containing putative transcriptional regulator [Ilumatobacteraceae bacterium]
MESASGRHGAPSAVELTTLGGLDVRCDGRRVDRALPDKALAVLVYLADADRPVSRSELAGLLWSDLTEERARANLRLALTKTRRVLPGVVEADRRSLWLAVAPRYDVALVEHGDADDTLRWYGGDFLVGVDPDGAELFDDWVRARRHSLRSTALLDLTAASNRATSANEWTRVIELAGRVLEIEPWNEAAHRQMMEALEHTSGRSAALAQFDHCTRLLASELGLTPEPKTVALATRIDVGEARHARRHDADIRGLPPALTPFFGREAEVDLIVERLSGGDQRLVTLAGPGGVGKTRLSIAAIDRVHPHFDMVVFASLAGVGSTAEALSVVTALVSPGGGGGTSPPTQQLVSALGTRRCLITLDNLEHLADDIVDNLADLLERCPHTTLLTTTRQPLDLTVEDVVEVRGLPVPAAEDDVPDDFGAVRLFVDRAYRVDKTFSLTDDNTADVVRLCRLVEGMPLHLELAASRMRHFSVTEVVDALEATAALPGSTQRDVPQRHASFAAVFDQSWELLDTRQQTSLARLAATRGGFDRRAAAVLTGDPVAASSIARRSLLVEEGAGRYRFHEVVRQAAAASLTDQQRDDAEIAHARHYLNRLATAAPDLGTWGSGRLADALRTDLDNFRVAWSRAIAHDLVTELGDALDGLCKLFEAVGTMIDSAALIGLTIEAFDDGRLQPRGGVDEATFLVRRADQLCSVMNDLTADALCTRALQLLDGRPERSADRAWALLHRARSAILRQDAECANVSLRLASEESAAQDPLLDAWITATRGRTHTNSGRFEEATVELERALQLFVDLDDPSGQSRVHSYLAPTYAEQYLIWKALESDRRALELAEKIGHRQLDSYLHGNVGASLILVGDYGTARQFTEAALEIVHRTGDLLQEGYLLVQLAECLDGLGDGGAEDMMSRGIALGRQHNDNYGLLYSLVPWSRMLLRVRRLDQATLATEELVEVAGSRNADHFAITARLIGARIDAAAGRTERARDEALRCWDLMSGEQAPRLPWPIDSRLDLVEVLGRHDPIGAHALAEATEMHRETARSIADPALRQTFIDAVPASRALRRWR